MLECTNVCIILYTCSAVCVRLWPLSASILVSIRFPIIYSLLNTSWHFCRKQKKACMNPVELSAANLMLLHLRHSWTFATLALYIDTFLQVNLNSSHIYWICKCLTNLVTISPSLLAGRQEGHSARQTSYFGNSQKFSFGDLGLTWSITEKYIDQLNKNGKWQQ